MRVISGKYKAKKIEGFNINGTKPTMDRVKESLFGVIQDYLRGATCLDLFAGSGSLGIEALSNGAKCCYFVDNGKIAYQVLQKNLEWIEEEKHLYKEDYDAALKIFRSNTIQFDIIFLDPPYAKELITPSLQKICEYNLLSKNGIVVCEYGMEEIHTTLSCIKEKKYGSTYIKIFKRGE